jgi:hypothetical protein
VDNSADANFVRVKESEDIAIDTTGPSTMLQQQVQRQTGHLQPGKIFPHSVKKIK